MFGLLGQIAEAFEQQGEGGAVMLSRRFVGEVRDIIRHVKGAR